MRIVVDGDKVKYEFLRSLVDVSSSEDLSTENLSTKENVLTCDKDKTDKNYFYSKKIPISTEVLFPKEMDNVDYDINDKLLWFKEFPLNEETLDKLRENKDKVRYCEVILVNKQKKGLSSDISTEEDSIKDKKIELEQEGYLVREFVIGKAPDFLFLDYRSLALNDRKLLKKELSDIKEEIDNYFESEYQKYYELENRQRLIPNHFTKYDKKYNGKKVIDYYINKACKFYFDTKKTEVLNATIPLYMYYLEKICVWNIDKEREKENIRKIVEKSFKEELKKCFRNIVFKGNTEKEYDEFLNEKQIISKFGNEIKKFFEEKLCNELKKNLKDKIKKLEGIIGE